MTLNEYIKKLPHYVKDENDEWCILTFRPGGYVDEHSRYWGRWVAGYMRQNGEEDWYISFSEKSLYWSVQKLYKWNKENNHGDKQV